MPLNPYALTTHDGKKVDVLTHYALMAAERRLGYPLSITQGSYNAGGVSASAGTHDGGGAVDLPANDWQNKVRALRAVGFCAWYRPAISGLWGPHIHAVLRGNERLSSGAARQVAAYDAHRDGLASNAYDPFPYHPTVTFKMPNHAPVRVAFANLNMFQGGDSEHLRHLAERADVLLLVECIDVAGRPISIADHLGQGWAVVQDKSTSAKAGSVVAWRTDILTSTRKASLKLLTDEVRVGGKVVVRTRYLMVQTLKVLSTGERYRFAAGHFPPNDGPEWRASWPAGIARVRRVRARPLLPPLVAGFDRNDDIHEFADDVRMLAEGRGIVGILRAPKRVRLVSTWVDTVPKERGWTDHIDVHCTIERK